MNITELTSPIRIYWDIVPSAELKLPDYRRIAGEIVSNKILSLQITESASQLSEAFMVITDSLAAESVALSLVISRFALETSNLGRLMSAKVIYVQSSSMDEMEIVAEAIGRSAGKPAIGLAFPVTRNNFKVLPQVLSFCVDRRIEHLLLPMQRLMTGKNCFSFSWDERKDLTARIGRIEKPLWLKLAIHDPFLWRAFYPSVEFPGGGCQAANTMLYISPEADVYPCPMMPKKIGNLRDTSLKDVIQSEAKRALRKEILTLPIMCKKCGESDQCKGGCRGRAFVMTGVFSEPDPACE